MSMEILGETPKIFNGSKDSIYEVEPCELHVKRWVNNNIIGAYHLVYRNIEHFKPIGTH
jgi:hypothetical protein